MNRNRRTPEEQERAYIRKMPASVRNTLRDAKRIVKDKVNNLRDQVQQIVDNCRDDRRKTLLENRLSNKDLTARDLEDLIVLAGGPVANSDEFGPLGNDDLPLPPSFLGNSGSVGANGGHANNSVPGGPLPDSEGLPLPTINWAADAKK